MLQIYAKRLTIIYEIYMLQTYKPTRELRSSTRLLLRTPPARLVRYGERSFQYIAPRLWNSLPEEIRRCESVASFKTNI